MSRDVLQKKDDVSKTPASIEHADTLIDNLFKKDKTFAFVYKKTQKLVSATYLLTSYFPETEPLRRELRENAAVCLRCILSRATVAGGRLSSEVEELKRVFFHMISLLETGYYGGLISQMNYRVLRREFETVFETLTEPDDASERTLFGDGFFEVTHAPGVESETWNDTRRGIDDAPAPAVGTRDLKDTRRSDDVRQVSERNAEPATAGGAERSDASDAYRQRAQVSPAEKSHGRLSRPDEKKNERRSVILDVIRGKGEVSIKDVSEAVSGCSEKTIQRELAALVKKGVLNKVGERRWSRYSLAA